MAYQINDKLKNLAIYTPQTKPCRIKLDANESPFNPADDLGAELESAFQSAMFNRYPDPYCTKLREAFAKVHGVPSKCVVAGNGSDELLSILSGAFMDASSRILSLSPDFSMYTFYNDIYGRENVVIDKPEGLTFPFEQVTEVIGKEKIDMIMFSNPCNPTSLGISRKQVLELVEGTDALVVVDEAYMDFWDESVIDYAPKYDNLIVLRTLSKAYSFAGMRLGFAVSNKDIIKTLTGVKSPYNVNALTQALAVKILEAKAVTDAHIAQIIKAREFLQASLEALKKNHNHIKKVWDSKTNFVLLEMDGAVEAHQKLMEKSVSVRLLDNRLRITAGTMEETKEFLRAFQALL